MLVKIRLPEPKTKDGLSSLRQDPQIVYLHLMVTLCQVLCPPADLSFLPMATLTLMFYFLLICFLLSYG